MNYTSLYLILIFKYILCCFRIFMKDTDMRMLIRGKIMSAIANFWKYNFSSKLKAVIMHSCSKSRRMQPNILNCLHFYVDYKHPLIKCLFWLNVTLYTFMNALHYTHTHIYTIIYTNITHTYTYTRIINVSFITLVITYHVGAWEFKLMISIT